ncbi:MAG: serine hydrolase [Patescibacteria group bacterium]
MRFKNVLPTILVVTLVVWGMFFAVSKSKIAQAPVRPSSAEMNFDARAFILPVTETTYLPIRNFNIADPEPEAKAVGLFDVHSEKYLYSKNINERLPIASVVKLMTAIVIMENLALNDIYTVAAEDINVDGKGADLSKGEKIKGGDLFKIMLIKSSNDAALTFARQAERQGINLVARLNEKAKLLGMNDSKFTDPAGLDDSDAFSTVDDLIKLVRYVEKYPIIWETLTTRIADVGSADGAYQHHLINTNQLLERMPNIIGGKTGYTDGALETMVLEVSINGGRDKLVSILLGSRDRFGETKQLIEWGVSAYRWK